jgi:predicted transcriptional regulator
MAARGIPLPPEAVRRLRQLRSRLSVRKAAAAARVSTATVRKYCTGKVEFGHEKFA